MQIRNLSAILMVLYGHLLLTSAIPWPKPGKKEDLYSTTPPSWDQNQEIPPPPYPGRPQSPSVTTTSPNQEIPPVYPRPPQPPSVTTNSSLSRQPLANQGSSLKRFFSNLRGSGLPVPQVLDHQLTITWLTKLKDEKHPLSVLQLHFTVSVDNLPSPDAFNGKFEEPYISDTITAMVFGRLSIDARSGKTSYIRKEEAATSSPVKVPEMNESSSTKSQENVEREKWKYLWKDEFVKSLYDLVFYLKEVEAVLGKLKSNSILLKASPFQAYLANELPLLEKTLPQAFLAREYLHKENAAKLLPIARHLEREVLSFKNRCGFHAPEPYWLEVDRLYNLVGLTKLCIEKSHCSNPVNAVVKYLDGILENKSMPNGYWLKEYLQESCDYFKSHINRGRGH